MGAGAAGVMVASRVVQSVRAVGAPHEVILIGDVARAGRGVAYSTADDRHLLNVPAGKMSAVVEDPGHFVRWLRSAWRPDVGAGDFAPRQYFGRYLGEQLDAVAGDDGVLCRVEGRVVGVSSRSRGFVLALASGRQLAVDAVVLATGTSAPGSAWAPAALRGSQAFVPDPWAPGALAEVPDDLDVLIVGTGLTMVDVALSLERAGRVVHAISRGGVLPRAHAEKASPGVTPVGLSSRSGLTALRQGLRDHVRQCVREHGDWRPAIDGLRPITSELWNGLSDSDREHFLVHDLRAWDGLRHRMAPGVARALATCRSAGRLHVSRGEITSIAAGRAGDLEVTLADGRCLRVGAVVNATGGQSDPSRTGDPLAHGLLADGLAQIGPHALGYRTDEEGRLVDATGAADAPLWALGSLRRGMLLETTAFPEIRAQARELADTITGVLTNTPTSTPTRRTRPCRDRYGLELTASVETAEAWDRALRSLLNVSSDADEAVAEVVSLDPEFALAQAVRALLADQQDDHGAAEGALEAAWRAAVHTSERERSFVAAVDDLIGTEERGGRVRGARFLRHIETWPRDALAVSVAVPTIAFAGISAGRDSWGLVEALRAAYGDDGWFAAQLAFVRQEQGRYDEAEALAARALAADSLCGHAVHARTHVFYETGDHAAGLAWLDGWLDAHGLRARHRAHFSWHAALHELSLGDDEALRRRYTTQLAPPAVTGSRVLVDSASLIWRCRMTGSAQDLPIGPVLDAAPPSWFTTPPTSFAGMHSALALAAAGDLDGLQRLRRHCAGRNGVCFAEVVAPLCAALADVVAGHWAVAAMALGAVVPRMVECGGSAAQREVVEDTWIHALAASGRGSDAARVLSARLDRRPSHRDGRWLAAVLPAGA